MMPRSRVSGLCLDERPYFGDTTPPAAFSDRSRWGNHGTHTNITWVREKSGLWVRGFASSPSLITLSSLKGIAFSTTFSVELWLNVATWIGSGFVYWSNLGGGLVHGAMGLQFFYGAWGAPYDMSSYNGNWVHITCVRSTTTQWIYVNASLVFPMLDANQVNLFGSSIYLGGGAGLWTGRQSLVRIHSYACTPAQVRDRFNETRHLFGV